MNRRSVTLAILYAAAASAMAVGLHEELIPNGRMTNLTERNWPAGWPAGRNARIEHDATGPRLVVEGRGAGVEFRIPLRPEQGRLRLSMRMKTVGVRQGRESWQTGRLTMSFHDAEGRRIGDWPNVFGFVGDTDWTLCEREYPVPPGAVELRLSPCNLGESGSVEFRDLSLTVSRLRPLKPEDAPLPGGFEGDPWTLDDAARQRTPTRERICLNGLWGFRPVLRGETAARPPPSGDGWGWFKVPGMWPAAAADTGNDAQIVWLSAWIAEKGGGGPFDQAWYRRRFRVPDGWSGRRVELEFTMLQTHARAFVDGEPCGELWYPGGRLDLTGRLTPGADHDLSLLVTARPLTSTRDAFMAPDRVISEKASVRLRGIAGDLFLESSPAGARIEDAWIVTSVQSNSIAFAAEVSGLDGRPCRLRAEVVRSGEARRVFESGDLTADGAGVVRFAAPWPAAEPWDTDRPGRLWTAAVTLLDDAGRALDVVEPPPFGFREVSLSGRDILLNGTPVRLRALHNATANSPADKADLPAAREVCRRMAAYGFNALTTGHYDFAPGSTGYIDGLLDACDETGILVCFSLPHIKDFGSKLDDPAVAARYRAQTRWLIRRVRHHPSVIFYAMNHNSTGYYGDQNPLKIDGVYEMPDEGEAVARVWSLRNRRQARIAEAIARDLDPTRPVYHHQSGHLGAMHTVNCYLNWAPIQERSDWLEHWATRGVKPLFFVEWGLPHISSWSSYRGPQFIWRCEAFQSLWAAEFAAQFLGDAAYRDDPAAIRALDHEAALWARGRPFHWGELNRPLRDLESNYQAIQARYAGDNWRAHRARGVSAMLPWDQGDFWRRVAATPTADHPGRFANLKRPGIVPDRRTEGSQFIYDPGDPAAFAPTASGLAFQRWNQPDCAFIGGPPEDFTSKDHLVLPGAAARKSLVILNDRRRPQTVRWAWALRRNGRDVGGQRGRVTVDVGGRAFVPAEFGVPADAADGERLDLRASFEFDGGATQTDEFALTVVGRPAIRPLERPVRVYDPVGRTAADLRRLGVPFEAFDGARPPRDDEVVVIGREALTAGGLPWMADIAGGGRVLVMEQRAAVLEGLLGFRVTERGARQLFPRFAHDVTRGLTVEHFRDWTGSATLLPTHLEGLPDVETHDPKKVWCGFTNTCVWRCGNRGSVASVLIEKPARGDWRALVDGEFDLQYAALLETVAGRGRVVFCQLDVTARTRPDPTADLLVVRLLDYLARAPEPRARPVRLAGAGPAADLLRGLGVAAGALAAGREPEPSALLVAGPGTRPPAGLPRAVEAGLDVICLGVPADELAAWCPTPVRAAAERAAFSRIERLPPELNGLSNADWAWHGRLEIAALEPPDEPERADGNAAIRVIRHGRGRVILWQAPPWIIDDEARPYLRTSRRRAFAMASRLLANLGAGFDPPLGERFARPTAEAWLHSYYLDTPVADDDPYRYYRW